MQKEDDIDHILNSLDSLLKEGAVEAPLETESPEQEEEVADKPLAEKPEGMIDEDMANTDAAAADDKPPLWVIDPDDEAEEAASVDAADDIQLDTEEPDFSDERDSEPKRLLLTEEMLDNAGQADAEAGAAADTSETYDDLQAADELEAEDAAIEPGNDEPDQARQETDDNETDTLHPLQDEQTRNLLVQQISSDVSARLAEELPNLIEACLNERLAELDFDSK